MKHQFKIGIIFVLATGSTTLTNGLFGEQIGNLASDAFEFSVLNRITLWLSFGVLYFDLLVLAAEYLPRRR